MTRGGREPLMEMTTEDLTILRNEAAWFGVKTLNLLMEDAYAQGDAAELRRLALRIVLVCEERLR